MNHLGRKLLIEVPSESELVFYQMSVLSIGAALCF